MIALAIVIVVFSIINPMYITLSNMGDIVDQAVIYGLMDIGMTFVIITGGIDLSVGAILAFVAVVAATLSAGGMNAVFVTAISLALSAVLGYDKRKRSIPDGSPTIPILFWTDAILHEKGRNRICKNGIVQLFLSGLSCGTLSSLLGIMNDT